MRYWNSLSILRPITLACVLALVVAAGGCSKKKSGEESDVDSTSSAVGDAGMGDSDSGRAAGLQTVHFGYDAYVLDARSKDVLKQNAKVLTENKSIQIQVEGHCDERGSIQYNLALGEKRAGAVRKYLIDLGVSGKRMTTISFGKEKPLDPGTGEAAWAKNRRANFVITSR